jgi:hypothetical protein
MPAKTQTVIHTNAKCSDLFTATLSRNGQDVGSYDGYVPDWFPGKHYGDYVELEIDADTGKILNWKKPTKAQLDGTFVKDAV